MKFVWCDQWYPAAFEDWHRTGGPQMHGTADYWDIALRAAGHESDTLIGNREHDIVGTAVGMNPDVICSQNVGLYYPSLFRARGYKGRLAGFCSYDAEPHNLEGWDVVFSSFKWLVDELNAKGQKAVWLPLAFGRAILDRVAQPPVRDLPLTFVGGLGWKIWKQGTESLAAVARAFPKEFKWWGYRNGSLPTELKSTFQGEAWGRKYWELLMRSQVTINRHGEIAKGEQRQNMREFESGGCAAYLMSDTTTSTPPGVCHYRDADDLIDKIRVLLTRVDATTRDAKEHQVQILQYDCYEHRVPAFLEALQ